MKVGVFVPTENEEHQRVLGAFAKGLDLVGIGHFVAGMQYRACDIAVVFGIGKKAVPVSWPRGRIIDEHQKRGFPVLILEKGFVRRDDYYHAGWQGLNGRADFRNEGMPGDRWAALQAQGIECRPWREHGDHVLVIGQVPHDASVQHSDHLGWCRRTVSRLQKLTDRPVRFRPHPKMPADYGYNVPCERLDGSLADALADAWAVVTFNSNVAVNAALAGVPVFAKDIGSMAWPVANHDLPAINMPMRPYRGGWLNDLAYAQWTPAEMASGATWRHLTRGLGQKAA